MEPPFRTQRPSGAWRSSRAAACASPDAEEHRQWRSMREATWHQEATEAAAGPAQSAEPHLAAAVLQLSCHRCGQVLSQRGMRVQLVLDAAQTFYSTDVRPSNILMFEVTTTHGHCGCQAQDFMCSCGLRCGYCLVEPCLPCRQSHEELGHYWFLSARCVDSKTLVGAGGQPLLWPVPGQRSETIAAPDWVREVPPLPVFRREAPEGCSRDELVLEVKAMREEIAQLQASLRIPKVTQDDDAPRVGAGQPPPKRAEMRGGGRRPLETPATYEEEDEDRTHRPRDRRTTEEPKDEGRPREPRTTEERLPEAPVRWRAQFSAKMALRLAAFRQSFWWGWALTRAQLGLLPVAASGLLLAAAVAVGSFVMALAQGVSLVTYSLLASTRRGVWDFFYFLFLAPAAPGTQPPVRVDGSGVPPRRRVTHSVEPSWQTSPYQQPPSYPSQQVARAPPRCEGVVGWFRRMSGCGARRCHEARGAHRVPWR